MTNIYSSGYKDSFKSKWNALKLCIKYPFLYPRIGSERHCDFVYRICKMQEKYHKKYECKEYDYGTRVNKSSGHEFKYIIPESLRITYDKKYKFPYMFWKFINQCHFIPTYSMLDCIEIPIGWRKSFIPQFLEELNDAMKVADRRMGRRGFNSYRYTIRISDMKEKFGYLNVYTSTETPNEVRDVISKYEKISYNTCACCGKPATVVTQGWILPYCNDCTPIRYNVRPIQTT